MKIDKDLISLYFELYKEHGEELTIIFNNKPTNIIELSDKDINEYLLSINQNMLKDKLMEYIKYNILIDVKNKRRRNKISKIKKIYD